MISAKKAVKAKGTVSREVAVREAINRIRRQFPEHPSTFGPCMYECNSGYSARGCGPCVACATEQLASLTNADLANQFKALQFEQRRLIHYMLDHCDDV